ncbi:MAG: Gmad2 immunoglobulin-like domain-containing protein [Actinomycetota bacterium]|nr:MAG: Spore germination protein-like [Actinomycetota bacterium]MDO8949505.1 Gmad2 immunoglobulin-like domain-containing protein [Actinomycetota bacterium]MDP3629484.1 Gmad2 immunoglobulin-like domain-containing protein [Actinomycetota bacterium]
MIRRTLPRNLLLVALAIALVAGGLAGCKPKTPSSSTGDTTSSVTPSATPAGESTDDGSATGTTVPGKPISVRVYLTRGEKIGAATRQIPATKAVASAAIRELLAGPTAEEVAYGLGTVIPADTELRGVTVKAGTATVDLSGEYDAGGGTLSMTMRLAQVVYTLTQFPTIDRVLFRIEGVPVTTFGGEGIMIGTPQTRDDYEDVTPAILVETPTPGQAVSGNVRVTGTSNVFEAVFLAEIRDAGGTTIAKKVVTSTSGTGTRGAYDVTIPFTVPTTQMGSLVVYEASAKDGSPINVVKISLKLTK